MARTSLIFDVKFSYFSDCPPYSSLDPMRRVCYMTKTKVIKTTQLAVNSLCKEFKYITDGHLPMPKTPLEVREIRLQEHNYNM